MRIRFLGTGTSFGIPVVGCDCPVCTSDEPRNRRTRHSLLIENDERALLVDTPPELRLQLLREHVTRVDAVFISHLHADHLHGIDDLRIFTVRGDRSLRMLVAREHEADLRGRFPYIFDDSIEPHPGTSAPEIDLISFEGGEELSAAGLTLRPLAFPHGDTWSYGFRTGGLGLIVDAKEVTEEARDALAGVDVLVVNALWHGNPHPTHFNVEEAVQVAAELGATRTFLTHLTHRVDYEELLAALPTGVEPAYDGLVVEVDGTAHGGF